MGKRNHLLPDVLAELREKMSENTREKYTDDELEATAYFLTISGFVPAAFIGAADVNRYTIAALTQFIALALLPAYIEEGAVDPVAINNFYDRIERGEIKSEQFTGKA